MSSFIQIVEIIAWPTTIIIVVMLLRSPLSELVPLLKKLKYKDLELDFEQEARKILAEAERDLPESSKPEPSGGEEPEIRFSLARQEPSTEILESWRHLELKLRELSSGSDNTHSTGYLVRKLASEGKISKETENVVLSLSSLRNKVAHTDEEVISHAVSSSFKESVARVVSALDFECPTKP